MTNVRAIAVALTIALLSAACTSHRNIDAEQTEPAVPPTSTQASERSFLVAVDEGGGLVIVEPDGTVVESIEPPGGARYTQPIWTSMDTVVYAQVATGDNRLEATRVGGDTVWSVELETPPFYYLAAPGPGQTAVVSLRNNADAPGLVIEQVSGEGAPVTLSHEAPFYASWNEEDGRLASHVGDARLDITGTSTETIESDASGFQAPVWLPSGLITLRTSGGDTFLTRWDDAAFDDIARVRGAARFVGSQDSVAIVTGGDVDTGGVQALAQALPTISPGVLTVVDLTDGSFTSVTNEPTPIFQWDALGEQLLYATFVDDPAPGLMWHVWEDGIVTAFEPFVPVSSWFGTVAPFFDQYAQSISLWSPDGSAFAYPALVDSVSQIMVQEVAEQSPTAIAQGTWVTWSP